MLIKFLFFIWGAIIGSFLNICIYRMPRSQSIISPGSHCVNCGAPIRWYENMPLFSYLFLRGRCSHCRKPISARYFIVEFLTAALFLIFYARFGLGQQLFAFLILACGLIVAAFIDLEYQLIPDLISLGGLPLGLLVCALHPQIVGDTGRMPALLNSFLGALAGGTSIYAIGVLGKILFKKKLEQIGETDAMGFGDVKFLAMIGAFLGWKRVLLVFFLAPIFGAAVGLALKIRYKKDIIPYGPYLALATVIVIIWGDEIVSKLLYW